MTSIFKGNFSEHKSEAIGTAQNKTVKFINSHKNTVNKNTSEKRLYTVVIVKTFLLVTRNAAITDSTSKNLKLCVSSASSWHHVVFYHGEYMHNLWRRPTIGGDVYALTADVSMSDGRFSTQWVVEVRVQEG